MSDNILEKETEKIEMPAFSCDSIIYSCSKDLIQKYLKVKNNSIGIFAIGVESPYALIDKEKKLFILNTEIDRNNLGASAEASRIKICAVLNTCIQVFTDKGYTFQLSNIGKITTEKSVYDSRKKGGVNLENL